MQIAIEENKVGWYGGDGIHIPCRLDRCYVYDVTVYSRDGEDGYGLVGVADLCTFADGTQLMGFTSGSCAHLASDELIRRFGANPQEE